ncbi:hypothetical protein Pmar_PMAR014982, partial [Perkinsus marinus ATCC 50983]
HDQILHSGLDSRGKYWSQSSQALKGVLSNQLFQALSDAADSSTSDGSLLMDQHSELKDIKAY